MIEEFDKKYEDIKRERASPVPRPPPARRRRVVHPRERRR